MGGGQRCGEMEVWAIEAHGAAHLLQEMLTVKSDDVDGRTKTYESIVRGEPVTGPGVPEGFKVLLKNFQAMGLDVRILTENNKELDVNEVTAGDAEDAIAFTPKPIVEEMELEESTVEEELLINDAEVEESFDDDDDLFDLFEE